MVENGEIAAVIIDDEATLKRVYYDKTNAILQLVPENPAYFSAGLRGSAAGQHPHPGKSRRVYEPFLSICSPFLWEIEKPFVQMYGRLFSCVLAYLRAAG